MRNFCLAWWRSLGAEFIKLYRSQNALVGCFGLLAFVGLWGYLFNGLNFRHLMRATEALGVDFDRLHNGFLFLLFVMFSAYHLLFPIFVANISGRQISGEVQAGTLRYNLARPVSRFRLFGAKWLLSLGYTGVLMGFFLVVGLAIGVLSFGWGELCLYSNFTMVAQGPPHLFDPHTAMWRFALAGALGVGALALIVSMAMMLSAWFDNPLVAVVGSITIYLIVLIFQENPLLESYRPYLFTDTMRFWTLAFHQEIPWSEIGHDALRCLAYVVGFGGVGLARFLRRDITS